MASPPTLDGGKECAGRVAEATVPSGAAGGRAARPTIAGSESRAPLQVETPCYATDKGNKILRRRRERKQQARRSPERRRLRLHRHLAEGRRVERGGEGRSPAAAAAAARGGRADPESDEIRRRRRARW